MGRCKNCNIEVLDAVESCPLCRSVLEPTDELENMYPNVRVRLQRLMLCSRIYLFCAIVAQAILFGINIVVESSVWWSAITGLALLFGYIILRYAILGKSGHKSKAFILVLICISIAVVIDFVTGYRGWSLDYALPAGILLVDSILVICMICNRRNWQSYIMWQILMVLCSLIPVLFFITGLERNPYMAFMPLAISLAIFLGTVIIGDRRARLELKRRFHII